MPVPEEELPVLLPELNEKMTLAAAYGKGGGGEAQATQGGDASEDVSPLARFTDWYHTT